MTSRPLSLEWCLTLLALIAGLSACGGSSQPPAPPPTPERPDAALSKVEVSRATGVLADGKDAVTLTVKVVSVGGTALVGRTVNLTVTGEGNTVTPARGQTNPDGVMTATLVSTSPGSKQVTASVDAEGGPVVLAVKPTVEFVEVSSVTPAKLAFTAQPVDGTAGSPLAEVRVALQNAQGETVTTVGAPVTLRLLHGPEFTAVTVDAVNGVATFSGLRIDTAGTGYQFEATSGALPAAQSSSFSILPASPARLMFTAQPASNNVRTTLAAVSVALQDAYGNTTSASSPTVTLSLTGGNPAATLSGTLGAEPTGGVAAFSDLSINQEGTDYQLVASAAGLTAATSAVFSITDNLAPAVAVISAVPVSDSSVRVSWTAVGDDGTLGTASSYDLRYATTDITTEAEFNAATPVSTSAPQAPGSSEAAVVTGLDLRVDHYFVLKVQDGAGNFSVSLSVKVAGDPCIGVTCTPPAPSCSADGRRVVAYTSACVVSGNSGVCQDTPNDTVCPSYETCSAGACVPVTAGSQAGSILISEFSALGAEFIELYNPTSADIDVSGYTLRNAAGQEVAIRALSDPNGTAGTPVMVPSNGVLHGIPNPSGSIPGTVGFVYGDPGTAFELADTGDALALYAAPPAGNLQDLVDFRSFVSDPDTPLTAAHFVGFAGSSTQLHSAVLTAGGNDTATNWCVSFYPSGARGARVTNTAGAVNGSCGVAVINELVIDGPGGDDADGFIEIAGPGGAVIGGARITDVEGKGSPAGSLNPPFNTFTIPVGTRIPADGILLIVDLNPDGRTTNVANYVPGVDIGTSSVDFENGGGDAYQLISADGTALLDAVGQEVNGNNLDTNTATANGLAMYEGSTALYPPNPSGTSVSLARSPESTDTNDNRSDFRADPSPTPGSPNDVVNPMVLNLTPDDGPSSGGARDITVTGTDFATGMRAQFGNNPSLPCTVDSSTSARCTANPNIPNTAVGKVNVIFSSPASLKATNLTLTEGFTYTGTENETDGALEADFCNLQAPPSLTLQSGQTTPLIFGRIYEAGVTEAGGAPAGIIAEVGYGSFLGSPTDPRSSNTWRFFPASFNLQVGNDDEFMGTFVAPTVSENTTFVYTFRFSQDNGLRWTYCDLDGAGSNAGLTFETSQLGIMTVTP